MRNLNIFTVSFTFTLNSRPTFYDLFKKKRKRSPKGMGSEAAGKEGIYMSRHTEVFPGSNNNLY